MYRHLKRPLDVAGAAIALLLTMPVWIPISAAVLLTDGLPILYRARRMGQHQVPFAMYKFRSMYRQADRSGPGITGRADSRITPTGAFLRRWKLDELPQLLNVLRGEMSLVGPRPEDPRYLPDYTDRHRAVLSVRPGITGPTQIAYRHEERLLTAHDFELQYRTHVLPQKLDLDLRYVEMQSFLTDVMVLAQTAGSIFVRKSVKVGEEGIVGG